MRLVKIFALLLASVLVAAPARAGNLPAPTLGAGADVSLAKRSIGTAADLAALGVAPGWAGLTVKVDGRSTAGGRGDAEYTYSTSSCSIGSGAGDGGYQVKPTGGTGTGCWTAQVYRGGMLNAGVLDGTGATDVSAALQAIIDLAPTAEVYLPAGTFRLSQPITLNNGQTMRGAGSTQTVLSVPSTWSNFSATGIVNLGSGSPGGRLFDLGISFAQPTPITRSTIIQYPPAIYASNTPQWQLDRVRISNAWRCLDARNRADGSHIGRLECGAWANDATGAIAFDGTVDFVHVESIECWPYGIPTGDYPVYEDQTTRCLSIGRVDGFSADKIGTFTADIAFTSAAASTGVPYAIGTLQTDGDGATLSVAGGRISVATWYTTKDASATATNALGTISAGSLTVGALTAINQGAAGPGLGVSGGILSIGGGYAYQGAAAQPFASISGGRMSITGVAGTYPSGTARSAPFYQQSGGAIVLRGNSLSAPSLAGGTSVTATADGADNLIAGNNFSGWPHTLPTGTISGYYDMAEAKSFTMTPTFQTVGDFAPTTVAVLGSWKYSGNYIDFEMYNVFNTNAYTTASGQFYFSGLPVNALSGVAPNSCGVGSVANITSVATLVGVVQAGSNTLTFDFNNAGGAISHIGTANVAASKSNVTFNFRCRYRYR